MAVERRRGLIALKHFIKKLQNHLQLLRKVDMIVGLVYEEAEAAQERVPDDVKEGQFAVLAKDEEKAMRFVVELSVLQHPGFLRLLKLAEEEFGFQQINGALELPCQPEELRRILQDRTA